MCVYLTLKILLLISVKLLILTTILWSCNNKNNSLFLKVYTEVQRERGINRVCNLIFAKIVFFALCSQILWYQQGAPGIQVAIPMVTCELGNGGSRLVWWLIFYVNLARPECPVIWSNILDAWDEITIKSMGLE